MKLPSIINEAMTIIENKGDKIKFVPSFTEKTSSGIVSARPPLSPVSSLKRKVELKNILSKGTFGTIYNAVYKDELICVKKIGLNPNFQNRELEIFSMLSHDNIVRYIEYYSQIVGNIKYLYLLMEKMPMTLTSYLYAYKQNTNIYKYRHTFMKSNYDYVITSCLKCVEYLHALQIIHRDLKPDNILINPENLKVKLCDFGCSKFKNNQKPNETYICTRHYRAPETILDNPFYDEKIDIWALGCIFVEIKTRCVLFKGHDNPSQLMRMFRICGVPSISQFLAMNPSFVDSIEDIKPILIKTHLQKCKTLASKLLSKIPDIDILLLCLYEKMLDYDPTIRKSASEILQLQYFTNANESNVS